MIFKLEAHEAARSNGCGPLIKQVARPNLSLNYAVETVFESISERPFVMLDLFHVCVEV